MPNGEEPTRESTALPRTGMEHLLDDRTFHRGLVYDQTVFRYNRFHHLGCISTNDTRPYSSVHSFLLGAIMPINAPFEIKQSVLAVRIALMIMARQARSSK